MGFFGSIRRQLGLLAGLQKARAARAAARAGDQARDDRNWPAAVAAYRRFIEIRPQHAGVLVQLGHALKENGDLREAEAAYQRAAAISPRDHDIPLQLGHVLKLQGRLAEARAAYARSDELAPVNHAALELASLSGQPVARAAVPRDAGQRAQDEEAEGRLAQARAEAAAAKDDPAAHRNLSAALLRAGEREEAILAAQAAYALTPDRRSWQAVRRAGGAPAMPPSRPDAGPHLYDLTDLLSLVEGTGRATGIQRVQLGLADGILSDPEAGGQARFVFLAERFGPLWTLAREDLEAIIRYCLHEPHNAGRARMLVQRAMDNAMPTDLSSARLFLIMGAFWFWSGAPAALARLRQAGLRIGVLVYDLIPVTHPEHTTQGTVDAFRRGLQEGAGLWDFAITISEYTARELRKALAEMEAPEMPVRPMPLAHRFSTPEAVPADAFPEAAADLRGRDYILCVGTIESRKNHVALFQAWQLLMREGAEPPPLVLVGRPGWRVGDLMAQLEATRFLDGRIRILHGISDPELEGLYRGALFSIFPSFNEGWGLPVGESLALGKLCLAAMEGATPEAGAGFAEPIDAYSPRDIAGRVRHFLEDRDALAAAEARLRAEFVPRTWADVTRHFLHEVADCMSRPPPQRPEREAPKLAEGQALSFAAGPDAAAWPASSLALGAGFDVPEEVGSWLIGESGTIHLECAAPLRLWLRLGAAPWARDNHAGVALEDGPIRWIGLRGGEDATLAIDVPAGPVTLRLVLSGPHDPPRGETRPIRVALREITAAAPEAAEIAPARLVVFGGGDPGWHSLLGEGWDLAADSGGVAAREARAVLRLNLPAAPSAEIKLLLQLTLRPGASGTLLHPAGTQELPDSGGTLLLLTSVMTDAKGRAELVLAMEGGGVPPIRLASLRWAAADDMAGRLAMLEAMTLADPRTGTTLSPERLRALEARLAAEVKAGPAALPGGEGGRAALRLAAARKG
ncbi:glycosyltransferase [Roseococcus sp. YIM B11640]|uniref:glycosyltransferase n=1 Tax=Roseococcus sp. YIM B11640 TaxID=3133973 RepID=UPI003C7E7FCB